VCYRSAIVRRLLAGGHTVRITCRDPSNKTRLAYLNSLPGAAARLSVFKVSTVSCSRLYSCPAELGCPSKQARELICSAPQADLEHAGSFDEPVRGCEYVIHTASPVIMRPPKGKVRLTLPWPGGRAHGRQGAAYILVGRALGPAERATQAALGR